MGEYAEVPEYWQQQFELVYRKEKRLYEVAEEAGLLYSRGRKKYVHGSLFYMYKDWLSKYHPIKKERLYMNDIQKHAEYAEKQKNYISEHIDALSKVTRKMREKLYQEVKDANTCTEQDEIYEQLKAVLDMDNTLDDLKEKLGMVCMYKFMND